MSLLPSCRLPPAGWARWARHFAIAWGMWRLAEGGRSAPMQRGWSTALDAGITCSIPPTSMALTARAVSAMQRRCWAKCWRQNPALRARFVLSSKGGIMPPLPYDQSADYLRGHRCLAQAAARGDDRSLAHPPSRSAGPSSRSRARARCCGAGGQDGRTGVSNFTIHQTAAHCSSFWGTSWFPPSPKSARCASTAFEDG
jgi:hypothetical protein